MQKRGKVPGSTKRTLNSLGVRPSKERGQNFLIRPEYIEAIVCFGEMPEDSQIVEIGPGTGALTEKLYGTGNLTVVEIESKFCEMLKDKFPAIRVFNDDARGFDFSSIGENLFVFGNIPYVFSTEIIFQLVKHRASISHVVLMVQKEFAQRIAAQPGGRQYGSLSVAVQMYADVSLGPIVPGTAFHPPTAVESQVIKLSFLSEPRVAISDQVSFEALVRAAFAQRRKKVINSLLSKGLWSREEIQEAFDRVAVSTDLRAERITIEEFAKLSEHLKKGAN
jgi:16S rRNA (adenine1518-N6/adenine1519-N6)-dimethyltransferase